MKYVTSRLSSRIIASLVACALIAGVAVTFVKYSKANATPTTKPAATATTLSDFSFIGATGWHQGPINQTSLALFSNDEPCFTSMEYKAGTIAVAAKLQQQQSDLAGTGAAMTPVATVAATLKANGSKQQYSLYQYSLSGGSEKLMGGLELGYLQLGKGYIEIQGHCNTAAQLPTTVPALQAYNFAMPN